MKKKFKLGDVCVMLYDNIVSQRNTGDIVLVEDTYTNNEDIVVQISEKEFIYMIPQFLRKIGEL